MTDTETPTQTSGWPALSGPLATLAGLGVTTDPNGKPGWLTRPRVTANEHGTTVYLGEVIYLSHHAIQDLARLIGAGWQVKVKPFPRRLELRITETP